MATEQAAPASEMSIEQRMGALFDTPEVALEQPKTEETVVPEVEEQPEDDGTEEFDVEGTTYRLPKELKAKVSEWKDNSLLRADYTRKTQELAELHKQAQITAETLQQRQAFEKDIETEKNELAKMSGELERYKAVDWANLEVEAYMKLRDQRDQLKDRVQELKDAIGTKTQKAARDMEQQRHKLVQEGLRYLQKAIPSWSPDSVEASKSGARSVGYTDGELENVYDARFVQLAWKAAQFDRLQAGKSAAVSSVQKAPPIVKPGAKGTPQVAMKDKSLREQLRVKGDINSAAALLAHRMR